MDPSITIDEAYNGTVASPVNGPALFLTGPVQNLNGSIQITNARGSLGETGSLLGKSVTADAPHGSLIVNLPPPQTYYPGGNYNGGGNATQAANPVSAWMNNAAMIWPGGNPDDSSFSGNSVNGVAENLAIAYVANAELDPTTRSQLQTLIGQGSGVIGEALSLLAAEIITGDYIGRAGNPEDTTLNNYVLEPYSSLPSSFLPGMNDSYVYYGNNLPWADNYPDTGTAADAEQLSPIGGAYAISGFSKAGDGSYDNGFFAKIPYESLTSTASAPATVSPASGQSNFSIYGGNVFIKAQTIDMNGAIEAGRRTTGRSRSARAWRRSCRSTPWTITSSPTTSAPWSKSRFSTPRRSPRAIRPSPRRTMCSRTRSRSTT